MSVIKRCYRGVLLMRVQSCYYLKRFCGATERMFEMGLRLEYHSDRNELVNAGCTRCVLFSLPMQIDAWETYSDFVRNDHYTRTLRYCETVTYNCVLKRSETLFKGRYRHSFREIDNTKLHNTCNLSTSWKSFGRKGNGSKGA